MCLTSGLGLGSPCHYVVLLPTGVLFGWRSDFAESLSFDAQNWCRDGAGRSLELLGRVLRMAPAVQCRCTTALEVPYRLHREAEPSRRRRHWLKGGNEDEICCAADLERERHQSGDTALHVGGRRKGLLE